MAVLVRTMASAALPTREPELSVRWAVWVLLGLPPEWLERGALARALDLALTTVSARALPTWPEPPRVREKWQCADRCSEQHALRMVVQNATRRTFYLEELARRLFLN
jgi:hypothetical protein